MPKPGVDRFVTSPEGVFLEARQVPWDNRNDHADEDGNWLVVPGEGQDQPNDGDLATWDNPEAPWEGATYAAPPPP